VLIFDPIRTEYWGHHTWWFAHCNRNLSTSDYNRNLLTSD
jgi:hypothetical protein